MMNFLQNLSIRTKLILLSVIPLSALVYYLSVDIAEELETAEAARKVIHDVEQINALSRVLHEYQIERALVAVHLTGNRGQTEVEMLNQWQNTDNAIAELEKYFEGQNRQVPFYRSLDSLDFIRAKIDDRRPASEVDPYYLQTKNRLLEGVAQILRSSKNVSLKNNIEEHLFLLYAKEYLAQTRTELAKVLSQGGFAGTSYGNFASVKGKHEINKQKFERIASPELRAFYDRKYRGPLVDQMYRIVDEAFTDPEGTADATDFETWWNVANSSIKNLKEVEDRSGQIITSTASAELTATNARVIQNIVFGIVIVLVIAIVIIYTLRGIIRSINSVRHAADLMAQGHTGMSLEVRSRDEIGALAASFNKMMMVADKFSEAATAIGKGNYTVPLEVRGPADRLGIALNTMKADLQELSAENEKRTWLLTGNNQVNDSLRGEKDIATLASDVLIQLVNHLDAQIGAIYVASANRLELSATYAHAPHEGKVSHFEFGEGLAGQAALEKKPLILNEAPENYIRIRSALGNAAPRNIVVFPLLMEGEVMGVLEIGSIREMTDIHLQLLNIVGENIAIAFHSAQSRAMLKELLEETQRQAEELEVQQEELKQTNEELTEKTRLLEKSGHELKAQQEELQQSNEELEEKANLLEEQKEKLELAKMEIENKARDLEVTSKYKSEFLANMSHELRTPLNSILILSQLLSENKNDVLGAKEVECCKNIYNSGADLLNLINEILDLSKVESGRMDLDIGDLSLQELRSSMEGMFTEVARDRAIAFKIQIDHRSLPPRLTTDRQRVEQILRNLLSNAFKFTPASGSVELAIRPAPADTAFQNAALYDARDVVAFSVIDTGIGIPGSKIGIVFEAFQQADGSTKRKYGGTGLGLSISRELATVLGGEIHVESREGAGSTFTLYLPAKFDARFSKPGTRKVEVREKKSGTPAREVPVSTAEKYPVSQTETEDDRGNLFENDKVILIMEDDPEFAKTLLTFVRERQYKGIIASSGNIGLSYARQYKPDAIILDMKMPVMDGTEVLKHLKNAPDLRHIPVQIISGYDHRRESLELGAFDFLSKPISISDLQKTFDRIGEFMQKKLKKLLVIEDDVLHNQAIRDLIGNGDVKSFPAYSGNEGYDMMMQTSFDCVIMDLGLPDMTGFRLLEKIRQNDQMKRTPIVVYTGRDLTRDEHAKLMKFANTVVLKTAESHERLLDETMLFLHRVESRLPKEKQNIIRKLHKTDEVLKNRKVLVVDDDIRNIYSLMNLLEEEGVNCLSAENGRIALEMLSQHPDIELVLMDVMMPEMDGYEATRAIRAIPAFSKLPVIALTAKAMKGDRENCLRAGMSDYIAKPLNNEQLLSLMRIWLYR